MHIAVPREMGRNERRVGLTPWAVSQLVRLGHPVVVEAGAGGTLIVHEVPALLVIVSPTR